MDVVRGWGPDLRSSYSERLKQLERVCEMPRKKAAWHAYRSLWTMEYFDPELGATIIPGQPWLDSAEKVKKEKMEAGTRVGAMISANEKEVFLLGYGTYDGREVPPEDIVGPFGIQMPRGENPKITLDDGTVVWGCECWWGPEEAVKSRIEAWEKNGAQVSKADIRLYRMAAKQKLQETVDKRNKTEGDKEQ